MRRIYIQVNGGALQRVNVQDAAQLTEWVGTSFHSPVSGMEVAEFAGMLWAEGFAVQVPTMLGGTRVWVIVGSDDPARIELDQRLRFRPVSVGTVGLRVRASVMRAFRHTSR